MKIVKIFLILSLACIFQNGFAQSEKTADPILFITFINAAGEERTKSLTEVKVSDLKDSVKHAEYRDGDKAVLVEGTIVYVPKRGLFTVAGFNNLDTLTLALNMIFSKNTAKTGDKVIFDKLIEVESKKTLNSIVFELK